MLKRIKSNSHLVKAVAWMLIFGFSGWENAAHALPCDTANFEGFSLASDGKSTLAITKQKDTWRGANDTAKAANGRLVVITSEQQNAEIVTKLGGLFTATSAVTSTSQTNKAWINLIDPLDSPAWSIEGSAPVVMPSRFSWGADFSAYQNWAGGQPDGYCTQQEQANHPDHGCYGEPWVVINTDGKWSDEGNHSSTDVTLKGVVEWPQVALDCVAPVSEAVETEPEALPGSENGDQYCTDDTQTLMTKCLDTTDGSKACPNNQVACNAVYETPACPPGSSLNTTRDMCQADPVNVCGAGYTWDSSIDKCVASATCSDGGVLNSVTDKCGKLVLNTCPNTYFYDSNPVSPTFDRCVKAGDKWGGTFNPTKDRCEAPPAWQCSTAGFIYNGTSGKCEVSPPCPAGMVYNTGTDRCEAPATGNVCPSGYAYSETAGVCIAAPSCTGGTYSSANNRCETSPSYSCTDISYSYSSSTGRCEKAPACAVGMTYNSIYDVCTQTMTIACSAGYIYIAERGRCEKLPECSQGVFNASTNKCEDNYTYNATLTNVGGQSWNIPVYERWDWQNHSHSGALLGYAAGSTNNYIIPPTTNQLFGYSVSEDITNTTISGWALYYWDDGTRRANLNDIPVAQRGFFKPIYRNSFESSNPVLLYSGVKCPSSNFCNASGTPSATGNSSYPYVQLYVSATPIYAGGTSSYTCPSGGSLSGSTCTAQLEVNPTCTNGTFDYANHVCYAAYTPTCSQGAYDLATGLCIASVTCSNGVLDGAADRCYQTAAAGCSGGYSLSGSTCVSAANCGAVGILNGTTDSCSAAVTWTCPAGAASDGSTCYTAPNCGTAFLNTVTDTCQEAPTVSCGSFSWDSTAGVCYSNPVCSLGAYDPAINTCTASLTKDCGTYTVKDAATCQADPTCASDPLFSLKATVVYTPALDKCVSQTQHDCISGTTYIGLPVLQCEAVPVCVNGLYLPDSDSCYKSQQTCPLGADFQCHDLTGDTTEAAPGIPMQYCSPNACQSDASGWIQNTDTESGLSDKKNDGDRSADGKCLGNIYLYNGTDMRCRKADLRGATGAYLQLAAMIALAATGAGAALAGALGASAGTVTASVIQAAVQLTVNTAIEAATTGFDANNLLMNGIAAIAGAAAGGFAQSANGLGDALADTVASAGLSTGINAMADPALSSVIQSLGNIVQQYQPAIQQGMLGNYSRTKCCYPDTMSGGCYPEEFSQARMAGEGGCHVVGEYCATRALSVCMVKKQTSCCFSSKLGRIFHEQGRPQLTAFGADGGWGAPRSPNCRGFTPEEFQSLNFGSMDLSEYVQDIEDRMQGAQPLLEQYMSTFGTVRQNQLNQQFPSGVPQQ